MRQRYSGPHPGRKHPGARPGSTSIFREISLERCLSIGYGRDMTSDDPTRPDLPPQRRVASQPHQTRQLTDARTLRALTHPVRIALLEALLHGGPQTATEAGERIGETPTTC